MFRNLLFTLFFGVLLGFFTLNAMSVSKMFDNDMVIQRNTKASIWGRASVGEKITVKASWGEKAEAVADKYGTWLTQLKTPDAGGPYEIEIKGSKIIKLTNVLSGDLWVASGQSNMEWRITQTKYRKIEMPKTDYKTIRFIDLPNTIKTQEFSEVKGKWKKCEPNQIGDQSAVSYYFAREITTKTGVPIGIIGANWGGTKIEPWIPPMGFDMIPELKVISEEVNKYLITKPEGKKKYLEYYQNLRVWAESSKKALETGAPLPEEPKEPSMKKYFQTPSYLFNGMIAPFKFMTIKGVIWYQGESNGHEGISYFHKKKALIQGWRKVFNNPKMPFYFVQLTSFRKSPDSPEGGDGWANIREAQRKSLEIPFTGMAVTVDIGDERDIHPHNKYDVGVRLSKWALAKDYGKDVVFTGPLPEKLTVKGDSLVVTFKKESVGSGLMMGSKKELDPVQEVKDGKLNLFAIQDSKNVWHWADAKIEGETVVVSAEGVRGPKAVRYGFRMEVSSCNLYNKEGLPASPFHMSL